MPFHDKLGGFAREGIGFLVSPYERSYDLFKDSEARKALGFAADLGKGPVSVPAFLERGPKAALGYFTGQNPIDSYKRYYSRYYHQPEYDPEDKYKLGFARLLPEDSPYREDVARAMEMLTHPTTLASGGLGARWRAGELVFIGGEFLARDQARKAGWSETQIDIAGLAAGAVASMGTGVRGPTLSRLAEKLGKGKGLSAGDLAQQIEKVAGFAKPIRDELVDAATTGRQLIRKNLRTATDEFKSKAINIADLDVATAKLGTIVRMPKTTRGMARYVIKTGPAPGWRDPRTSLEKLREAATGRITEGTTYEQRELTRGLSEQFKEFGLDPFFWTPLQKNEPLGIWNPLRTVSEPDVRRGGNAIIKRLDLELDKGLLGHETHLLAREFVRQLAVTAPHLLENVGFSTIKSLGGVNPALVTQGQFDLASHIVTIAKGATNDPKRLALNPEEYVGTLAHELSHSFELWISEVDLLKVVNKYNKELESTGKRAIREAEDAFAYVAELKMLNPLRSRIARLTGDITSRRIGPEDARRAIKPDELRSMILDRSKYQATLRQFEADLPKLVSGPELDRALTEAETVMAQAVNRAYRYTSIHEFVAENLKDRLLYLYERGQLARMGQSMPAPKPDALFDRAIEPMRQIIAGVSRALRVFGAPDNLIEEISEKLLVKHYQEPSPAMRRGSYGLDRKTILGGADAPATPSYFTPEVAAQQEILAETVHGPWIRDPSIEAIEKGQGERVLPKIVGLTEEGNIIPEPAKHDREWQRQFDELLKKYESTGDPALLEGLTVYSKEAQLKLIDAMATGPDVATAKQFIKDFPDKYFENPHQGPGLRFEREPQGGTAGFYRVRPATVSLDERMTMVIAREMESGKPAIEQGKTIVHEWLHHSEHLMDDNSKRLLQGAYKEGLLKDGKVAINKFLRTIEQARAGRASSNDVMRAYNEAYRYRNPMEYHAEALEEAWASLHQGGRILPNSLLSVMGPVREVYFAIARLFRDIFKKAKVKMGIAGEPDYAEETLYKLLDGEFPPPRPNTMYRSYRESYDASVSQYNPSLVPSGKPGQPLFSKDVLDPDIYAEILDEIRGMEGSKGSRGFADFMRRRHPGIGP